MRSEEEKDIYIKAKIKDGYVPEKINNLFNNSAQILEDEGGMDMEENTNKPKKNKIFLKRIAGIAACVAIVLGGGQIYASTQGYDNIFFLIKEWIMAPQEIQGKDEILSDRDITISYQPIQITKNVRIVISKMQIKDNETKIILSVNRNDTKENDGFPLSFKIYNSAKELLCEQTSNEDENSTSFVYQENLILKNYSKEDKVLDLEIYKTNEELISTISIDLENKEINVLGQEEHIEKLSEIELKEFLGSITKQHVADLTTGTCIDITNISYSGGYYTITYTYCFLEGKSLFDIDINKIDIYQNTVAIKLNQTENDSDSKFEVISIEEPIIIQKNEILTNDIGTELWADFAGTYALKNAYNNGIEINPKEWENWSGNNWLVFHNDGTFTDTLFSKIFTDRLTTKGKYKFKSDFVELTYSNEAVIKLEGDVENYYLTGKIDGYDVVLETYGHTDLSIRNVKFVGSWDLEYGIDWSNGETKKIGYSDLYDEEIYGTMNGANITLSENGSVEYSISGNKKTSRRIGNWENIAGSDNVIKVKLSEGTIFYIKYELDSNDKEYIGFQSKSNDMYYEYYSKDEEKFKKEDDVATNKNEKVDNYASSMSWAEYWSPGIKFQYPTIFKLKEVGGYYRGNSQGKVATIITGVAKGINPDTKEIINTNLQIDIYEPIYKPEFDEETLKNKTCLTNSKGMTWYSIDYYYGKDEYVHYSDGWEYRICFSWDNQEINYKVINIINRVLGSTKITSY